MINRIALPYGGGHNFRRSKIVRVPLSGFYLSQYSIAPG